VREADQLPRTASPQLKRRPSSVIRPDGGLDGSPIAHLFISAPGGANGRVQPRCGAQRSNVGCNPLLGFVVMFYDYDYVPHPLPCFHVSMGIGGLFEWKAFVNNGFYLPCLNQFLDVAQVCGGLR
jgi:hypothetical protein